MQTGGFAVPATSIRYHRRFHSHSRYARWMRSTISTLVLAASVAALILIVHRQHPAWFKFPVSTSQQFAEDELKLNEINEKSAMSWQMERDRAIAAFLASRYRVSQDVIREFVGIAFAAGSRLGVDPLLIIAVMAVESRFNPIAESVAGAQGLMQIIPKFHTDKLEAFGGTKAVLDPRANILVGSQILKDYIKRAGDESLGLRIYSGGSVEGENQYPARVLDEKRRLQQVVSRHGQAPRPSPSRANVAL
jgi:soluble lytic murein transglycosylase-like protein